VLQLYKGKINELTFEMSPDDYIQGSTFVFTGKRSRRDEDSAAVIKASTALGILYEPTTGKGLITLTPSDTAREGAIECDLQMIAPSGAAYPIEGAPRLEIVQSINRGGA
jgi:hypothetical protein